MSVRQYLWRYGGGGSARCDAAARPAAARCDGTARLPAASPRRNGCEAARRLGRLAAEKAPNPEPREAAAAAALHRHGLSAGGLGRSRDSVGLLCSTG